MLDIIAFARPGRHIKWRKQVRVRGLSARRTIFGADAACVRSHPPAHLPSIGEPSAHDDLSVSVIRAQRWDGSQAPLAVTCAGNFPLREIRICMEDRLEFRPCPEGGVRERCTLDTARNAACPASGPETKKAGRWARPF